MLVLSISTSIRGRLQRSHERFDEGRRARSAKARLGRSITYTSGESRDGMPVIILSTSAPTEGEVKACSHNPASIMAA